MPKDTWDKIQIIGGVVLIPLIVVMLTGLINITIKDRENEAFLLMFAYEIIKSELDPNEYTKVVGDWAINFMNEYLKIRLSKHEDKHVISIQARELYEAAVKVYRRENLATIELISDPPGAKVILSPIRFSKMEIPLAHLTPTEFIAIPSDYKIKFILNDKEIIEWRAISQGSENVVKVKF